MPRKSAAALAVLPPASRIQRPEPPERLNKEEAEEWRTVVGRLPPEWFPAETLPMLEEYCIHVIRSRMIAEWMKGFRAEFLMMADGLERVDKLLAMGEREAKAIAYLATKMRLTQQSRWQPVSADRASKRGSSAATHGRRWREPAITVATR